MRVTFFKNFAARTMVEEDLTIEQLAEKIKTTQARTKQLLPWLKLARFGDKRSAGGCLRNNANVLKLTGAEGDYDGEKLSIEDGREIFEKLGVEAILYTTPSWAEDKPRWRALMLFSRELTVGQRNKLIKQINEAVGDIFSWESKTLSQSYYFGQVEGAPPIHVEVTRGKPVDEVLFNPFLDHDVSELTGQDNDTMLEVMTYRDGDNGIHNTQLRVSASLLGQGWDEDDVVDKIMAATRRACEDAGRDWSQWERGERKRVEGMCSDFEKKREKERRARPEEAEEDEDGNVVPMKHKINKKKAHIQFAQIFCQELRNAGSDILRSREEWWLCRGGRWEALSGRGGDEWIESEVGKLYKLAGIPPTHKAVREVLAEVRRSTARDSVPWDAHGLLPVANGMLDLKTRQLRSCVSHDYARRQLPVAYDPEAECPTWLMMLDERFDAETIYVLQENLGAALLPRRTKDQRRALIVGGPSNGGKSAYLDVVCRLLSDTAIATSLGDVDKPHGTMPFRDRFAPWRLDEAFKSGTWHPSDITKAILSGNPFSVNVKNGPMVLEIWDGAAFWATNVPAAFKEATKAIENRVLLVDAPRVFDPKRRTGAALFSIGRGFQNPADLVVAEEMPGVLNWALEGADRISKRGYYELPESLEQNLEEFREDSNPLHSFMKECVEYDSDACVSVPDLHYAFASFVRDDVRTIPSAKSLGRLIRALGDERIAKDMSRLRTGNKRFYAGICLNEYGLEHWSSRSAELGARGLQVPGSSDAADDVNKGVPAAWHAFPAIKRMRKAHKTK